MCSPYKIVLKSPGTCSGDELLTFTNLVKYGEEVEEHRLQDRVKKAIQLAILYDGDEIIGVGGIKKPNTCYHYSVFKKAKTDLFADDYPFEIGWIYIKCSYRRRGLGGRIVDELMAVCPRIKLFSTSRANNQTVRKLLEKKGFNETGVPYISKRDNKTELILYVTE